MLCILVAVAFYMIGLYKDEQKKKKKEIARHAALKYLEEKNARIPEA